VSLHEILSAWATAISGATKMDLSMTAKMVLAEIVSHRIKATTIRNGEVSKRMMTLLAF
jgi:hypothetical protein